MAEYVIHLTNRISHVYGKTNPPAKHLPGKCFKNTQPALLQSLRFRLLHLHIHPCRQCGVTNPIALVTRNGAFGNNMGRVYGGS